MKRAFTDRNGRSYVIDKSSSSSAAQGQEKNEMEDLMAFAKAVGCLVGR